MIGLDDWIYIIDLGHLTISSAHLRPKEQPIGPAGLVSICIASKQMGPSSSAWFRKQKFIRLSRQVIRVFLKNKLQSNTLVIWYAHTHLNKYVRQQGNMLAYKNDVL